MEAKLTRAQRTLTKVWSRRVFGGGERCCELKYVWERAAEERWGLLFISVSKAF